MQHYSKLVRDRLPDIVEKQGGKVEYHFAGSDEEFWRKLKEKLQEECDEFSKNETMENFGDIFDVLDAMIAFKQYDVKEINALRENKSIEKGKYDRRIILDSSSEQIGLAQDQLI